MPKVVVVNKIDALNKKQAEFNLLEGRVASFTKPIADPHANFPDSQRIRNASYEIPEGLTEEQTKLLVVGAMLEDSSLDKMRLGEGAENDIETPEFLRTYVLDNVLSNGETVRLGNLPMVLGEARERAAKAFQEYIKGNKEAVRNMGESVISKLYRELAVRELANSETTMGLNVLVKNLDDLMNHSELGLQNILSETQKEKINV